jgi:hypothetical protein
LRAWQAWREALALLVPQRRTEGPEAKEELVRQRRETEAQAVPEHPVRQPEQSKRRIRKLRSQVTEQT